MQVLLITAVLATVILCGASYEFGPLCCSNPINRVRGRDRHGSGAFGSSRGSKTHKGLDIECPDGSKVYAPMDMTITRQSRPYGTNSAIDNGIAFTANDLPGVSFKLWYMHPVKTSGTVRKGEQIGTMLPMQSVYPGITSHVHLEKGDETDPQSIIGTQNAQANRLFCSHRD
ncbi:leukocyte cell-derived chemotaxin-2-like [Plectropomus leopardus]|uniref:leukocyte cell-derived chemotaxin-2-like n=1 Tax=Plectropomus leopardus TaxID=160734 RepID=UPI001C4DA810|nr:leukocyte cell-derived chemotaxin-2-like [Plectropomus leopardus]XP_042364394.1 leukocyte cell-derived chemotaxin-2-like [Plectropomus leopardus]XP_042364474.1 leukocyte cell-derived chemotaxin-2-like [Plectropomus leopardus]